ILGGAAGVGLNKTTTGTASITSSGAFTYPGATNINDGTLADGSALALSNTAVVIANLSTASLNVTASSTIGSLAGGGAAGRTVTVAGNTLSVGNDNTPTTFSGTITGTTGGLTKVGTGTLTLANTDSYSGATTISTGTLKLGGSSTDRIPDASSVSIVTGAF